MSNEEFSLTESNLDFTISRMLSEKNLTVLKRIAKYNKLKGYSKMKKGELESSLVYELCTKERLIESLYCLDKKKWMLFKELSSVDYLELDDKLYQSVSHMENLGIALSFTDKKLKYAAIPSEIKKNFDEICDTYFMKKREIISLYDDYTNSAMAIYGLVKHRELVEIFETLSGRTFDRGEMLNSIKRFSENGAEYCMHGEYIVSKAFEENGFEDVQKFANIIYANPRYTPDEKEFLKYASYEYYEITSEIIALKNYLVRDMNIEDFVANLIIDEIHHLSAIQAKPQEFVDVFNKYRIITKEKQVYDLMDLVHEVSLNTRLVGNHGHTQCEIMEIRGEVVVKKTSAISEKIGRNESCICGSGRKFKKCCGA